MSACSGKSIRTLCLSSAASGDRTLKAPAFLPDLQLLVQPPAGRCDLFFESFQAIDDVLIVRDKQRHSSVPQKCARHRSRENRLTIGHLSCKGSRPYTVARSENPWNFRPLRSSMLRPESGKLTWRHDNQVNKSLSASGIETCPPDSRRRQIGSVCHHPKPETLACALLGLFTPVQRRRTNLPNPICLMPTILPRWLHGQRKAPFPRAR